MGLMGDACGCMGCSHSDLYRSSWDTDAFGIRVSRQERVYYTVLSITAAAMKARRNTY